MRRRYPPCARECNGCRRRDAASAASRLADEQSIDRNQRHGHALEDDAQAHEAVAVAAVERAAAQHSGHADEQHDRDRRQRHDDQHRKDRLQRFHLSLPGGAAYTTVAAGAVGGFREPRDVRYLEGGRSRVLAGVVH